MKLSGYSNLTPLAQGGMASLYKARQDSLNRSVVIKFLSAEYLFDDDAKQQFEQESLVIAQLNHPNIIHIIDRGLTDKGRPYFVMDYVHGHDLSDLMRKGGISDQDKTSILMQICKAMACAHKNGVIHRDIKPANVVIDKERHAHVLDFGIAWLEASGHPEEIVGTPDYMSPEQFNTPESVTYLSDIYSFGVMMYELFVGKLPSAHFDDLMSSMTMLPQKLAILISECLQTDIEERPKSSDDIRLRLLKIMQGAHISSIQKKEAKSIIGNLENKFILLDIIKRDEYGGVYLFEDKVKHNLLVIKKRFNTKAGFKEASLLSHMDNENLIKILGTSKNSNAFIVVMEHLTGGSLQDRLSRPYATQSFVNVAIEMCSAMKSAHKHKIFHGNLRPSNVLFDKNGKVKITDFGFDEHYDKSKNKIDWYQSEDEFLNEYERDIYSAGAVFYHMLTGVPARFDHGRIHTDSLFNALDERLRILLRNIMEKDSSSHYKTFKEIFLALSAFNKSNSARIKIKPLIFKGKSLVVKSYSVLKLLFYSILVINIVSALVYFFYL